MTNDEHAEILRLIEKADSLWDVSELAERISASTGQPMPLTEAHLDTVSEHLDRIAKRMEAGN
jgi:hypothetical protein